MKISIKSKVIVRERYVASVERLSDFNENFPDLEFIYIYNLKWQVLSCFHLRKFRLCNAISDQFAILQQFVID